MFDIDLTGSDRRTAAEKIHVYLRDVLMEEDIADISPAAVLRDLYDCRVCVNHIAQVYLKGIMDPVRIPGIGKESEFLIFDAVATVSKSEAEEIALRVGDRDKRRKV